MLRTLNVDRSLRALAMAAFLLGAAAPALAQYNFGVGDPKAEGGEAEFEISRTDPGSKDPVKVKVTIKVPKNTTAKGKADLIRAGYNGGGDDGDKKPPKNQDAKDFGPRTVTGTNWQFKGHGIQFPGTKDSKVTEIKKTKDTTGEVDINLVTGQSISMVPFDLRLDLDRSEYASGSGFGGGPSELVFGVSSLYVSTISIEPGMTGQDVLAALYADLISNPDSPQLLRDAVSFGDDGVQIYMGEVLDIPGESAFGGSFSDTHLAAGATWSWGGREETVPTPATAALLGLGALVASRRRRH